MIYGGEKQGKNCTQELVETELLEKGIVRREAE